MLKGINKQIIEIKCTENECFDKILLFVNANKNHLHGSDINCNWCGNACSAAYRIVYVISINIIDKICVNRRKSI